MAEICLNSEKILDCSDSPGFWKNLGLWQEPRRGSVCICYILEAFPKSHCKAAKRTVYFTTVWFWRKLRRTSSMSVSVMIYFYWFKLGGKWYVCMCIGVCVWERERDWEFSIVDNGVCVCVDNGVCVCVCGQWCVCVCVCVCVWMIGSFLVWTWTCCFRWSLLGRVRGACTKRNRVTSENKQWVSVIGVNSVTGVTCFPVR